jgi:hypothetical protein
MTNNNNNNTKGHDMSSFDYQQHPEETTEYDDYVSNEELASDLEWDAHWAAFDTELGDASAELQLAADNPAHYDDREDNVLDEHINMQSRHDNDRDLDFLDS